MWGLSARSQDDYSQSRDWLLLNSDFHTPNLIVWRVKPGIAERLHGPSDFQNVSSRHRESVLASAALAGFQAEASISVL